MAGSETIAAGIDRRRDIMRFFREYTRRNGIPPTMQEVATGVGLQSRTSVRHHVEKLIEQGQLTRVGEGHRNITMGKK